MPMLFNLFGKKDTPPAPVFLNKTYAHTSGKMKACVELAKENSVVIFIAWFSDTLHDFKAYFTQNGVDEDRVKDYRSVNGSQLQNLVPVFVEHHPLLEKEKELVATWPVKTITFYNALDEAVFEPFGGEKIIGLMEKWGLKEDEAVEHSMISQSIINAQKKIAKKVTLEQAARSQKEWMERNAK
jgi:hypothetical protein